MNALWVLCPMSHGPHVKAGGVITYYLSSLLQKIQSVINPHLNLTANLLPVLLLYVTKSHICIQRRHRNETGLRKLVQMVPTHLGSPRLRVESWELRSKIPLKHMHRL